VAHIVYPCELEVVLTTVVGQEAVATPVHVLTGAEQTKAGETGALQPHVLQL
jgi:hypothetical protein